MDSIVIAGAHDARWTAAPRAPAARQNGSRPSPGEPAADDADAFPSTHRPLKAAVVHADPEARHGLLRLLAGHGWQVAAVCQSGCEALERIPAAAPDVVYVAVRMRGMDGFELLEALGPRAPPVVVLVSPRGDDAVRAFDTQAVDYLLEPVTPERFLRSLRRAKAFLAGRRVMEDAAPPTPPPRAEPVHWMLVDHRGASIPLQVARIGWIEASDNYVKLHAEGQTYLIRESMARIITRLDATRFVRIHRSVIVNMEAVKELHPTSTGDDVVMLKDGTTLRMSRRYARQLGSAIADYR